MAITKQKKAEVLEKLRKIVKDSISIVFVNFHSLPVAESTNLRRALKEKGIGMTIAKKTLTKKALAEGNFHGDMPEMPGELGIVYGTDSLEPASVAYGFQKKLDKKIQIIGGIFEGKFMTKEEMLVIAQIPGMVTLRGMFVNLINSPIQRFVISLDQIAQKK